MLVLVLVLVAGIAVAGTAVVYLADQEAGAPVASNDEATSNLSSVASPRDETGDSEDETVERLTDEALARRFGSSVYRVEVSGCGLVGGGTAFVTDERHLVTNFHVVSIDTAPVLVGRDGEKIHAQVVGWSQEPDIAVVRADSPLPTPLDWADTEELREGQPILTLGYPLPDADFSATPGSIVSFQTRDGLRQAIRTNAAVDKGNSGAPALDEWGRVAGVVTALADNSAGFQLVPLLYTRDALQTTIEQIKNAPTFPAADCASAGVANPLPDDWQHDRTVPRINSYGDDDHLDGLWDACASGHMPACDELYLISPYGSEYEWFGQTCGDRIAPQGFCTVVDGNGSNATGDPLVPVGSWIIVLRSMDVAIYDRFEAADVAAILQQSGINADVLLSTDYASLNPGYWVVYTGYFDTEDAAAAHCRSIRTIVPDCYQRELRS